MERGTRKGKGIEEGKDKIKKEGRGIGKENGEMGGRNGSCNGNGNATI